MLVPVPHHRPHTLLFDWHATLVDSHDAMYLAVDDVIPRLAELELLGELADPEQARNLEDAKLLLYVQKHGCLHPKIRRERKVSRTDIFEILFGDNPDAKRKAHAAFDDAYGRYAGLVSPFEPETRRGLETLRSWGLKIGILSNRSRIYMEKEVASVEPGGWMPLTDALVCGDDVPNRKPAPDLILESLRRLEQPADRHTWYVGDSSTDVVAAKRAEVTAVFYNGAGWTETWLNKVFPATASHPHRPDAVADNMQGLLTMVRRVLLAGDPPDLMPDSLPDPC